MTDFKIKSAFAILDVEGGRRALERKMEKREMVPVVIYGVISDVHGSFDGESQEFQVDVDRVEVGIERQRALAGGAAMSGHTRGPWTLETVRTSCGICHRIGPFPWRKGKDLHACVYVYWPGDGAIEAELLANAALMRAAPELLDALTQAEACMSIVEPRSDKAEYLRILGVVRAAIASATPPEKDSPALQSGGREG